MADFKLKKQSRHQSCPCPLFVALFSRIHIFESAFEASSPFSPSNGQVSTMNNIRNHSRFMKLLRVVVIVITRII